ncbi:hypothetical protein PU560_08150 [Georgenia sp. 10Sc9-8]|uniref:Uncharacterized protein n=1 Tax=Georgenia halotolerans TaxID=3028317 RepID=A0ABT5TZA3_9MICO|nr:hypothetical protein [Georgenia halotolerans]
MMGARQQPNAGVLSNALVAIAMLLTGSSLVISIASERANSLHYVLLLGCAALFVFAVARLWKAVRRPPAESSDR